jgi:hypothetical protein
MEHNLIGLSSRVYLDKTVMPVLTLALEELAEKRPENPLEFLGNFLIRNS